MFMVESCVVSVKGNRVYMYTVFRNDPLVLVDSCESLLFYSGFSTANNYDAY